MADFLTGLGVLLALAGPLLLIPLVWLLYRFALKPFFGSWWKALTVAAGLVALLLAATYFPGKQAFDRMCAAEGEPEIKRRVKALGFFRSEMFPYEAVLYITQNGFQFVEAPDPYRENVTIRYSLAANGEVRQDETETLRSEYGVRKTYELLEGGVSKSEKVVYELESGEEVAHASELVYQGGPLAVFLGTFGLASCPNPRTPKGARDFQIYYDLESYVLGGKALP
jgi:hypothetical protein